MGWIFLHLYFSSPADFSIDPVSGLVKRGAGSGAAQAAGAILRLLQWCYNPVPCFVHKESFMRRILFAVVLTALSTFTYASAFKLSSSEIKANHMIPQRFEFNGFGCSGENKSPELKWSGAPKGTKSFAVTVYDPDAPTGSGWWHWVVIDIPADVHELAADAGALNSTTLPKGAIQGRTDYGVAAFGGTCPPKGDKPHRYIFTVYALKVGKLDVPDGATAALTGYMIHGNMLGKASFTAKYGRAK
jgi:Raf kinase inhibitor-like YbhB/YbcL family protein